VKTLLRGFYDLRRPVVETDCESTIEAVLGGGAPECDMTPIVWRELHWYATVMVSMLEWLGVALIVWGCAVAGLHPREDLWSSSRRLASTPKREVRRHARQGIHEIEGYLACRDHHY
jgi:hypothetical protein